MQELRHQPAHAAGPADAALLLGQGGGVCERQAVAHLPALPAAARPHAPAGPGKLAAAGRASRHMQERVWLLFLAPLLAEAVALRLLALASGGAVVWLPGSAIHLWALQGACKALPKLAAPATQCPRTTLSVAPRCAAGGTEIPGHLQGVAGHAHAAAGAQARRAPAAAWRRGRRLPRCQHAAGRHRTLLRGQ